MPLQVHEFHHRGNGVKLVPSVPSPMANDVFPAAASYYACSAGIGFPQKRLHSLHCGNNRYELQNDLVHAP
jgi:hypothetical protein